MKIHLKESTQLCKQDIVSSKKHLALMIDSCNRDAIQGSNDDCIHMGHAIMTFYSALIDLLGRCAPEMHVSDAFFLNSSSLEILTKQPLFWHTTVCCHTAYVNSKVAYIKIYFVKNLTKFIFV